MLWSKWHEHTEILTSLLCIDWLSQPRPLDMLQVVILIHCDLVWWIHRKKSNIRVLRERSRTAWVSLSSLPRINHFFQDERKWQTTQKTFLSSAKKGKTFFCIVQQFSISFFSFCFSAPLSSRSGVLMRWRWFSENFKRATSRPGSLSENGKLLSGFSLSRMQKSSHRLKDYHLWSSAATCFSDFTQFQIEFDVISRGCFYDSRFMLCFPPNTSK